MSQRTEQEEAVGAGLSSPHQDTYTTPGQSKLTEATHTTSEQEAMRLEVEAAGDSCISSHQPQR